MRFRDILVCFGGAQTLHLACDHGVKSAVGEAADLRLLCTALFGGGQPAAVLAHRLASDLPGIQGTHPSKKRGQCYLPNFATMCSFS